MVTPTSTVSRDGETSVHWGSIACRWSLVKPPLRPSDGDIRVLRDHLLPELSRSTKALILGVTPELFDLFHPVVGSLHAMDRSQAMIDAVWPGPCGSVTRGDWRRLPYPAASLDMAACDGGLHLLDPDRQDALARELCRVLDDSGIFSLRLFEIPPDPPDADRVLEGLMSGRLGVSETKMRLAMALQPSSRVGVRLADVWSCFSGFVGDPAAFALRHGCDASELRSVESYRDCESRYHFVSRDEAVTLFERAGFRLRSCHPSPASSCPTLIFRKRGGVP